MLIQNCHGNTNSNLFEGLCQSHVRYQALLSFFNWRHIANLVADLATWNFHAGNPKNCWHNTCLFYILQSFIKLNVLLQNQITKAESRIVNLKLILNKLPNQLCSDVPKPFISFIDLRSSEVPISDNVK